MQWRMGHKPPKTVKISSHTHHWYCDGDEFDDEKKDDYEAVMDEDAEEDCDETNDKGEDTDEDEEMTGGFSETLVETQLTLPNFKPDIERILRVLVKSQVHNWEPVRTTHGTQLLVTGLLSVGVEYVAKVLDQSMHFTHFDVPFHVLFFCGHATKVAASVEYLHYDTVDPRSIDLAVLVTIDAS